MNTPATPPIVGLAPMARLKAALTWASKNKTAILAAVLTGGEAIVGMGIPLPGSDLVPVWARGSLIGMLTAAALFYRTKASQETA